jgi:hypothetical protein
MNSSLPSGSFPARGECEEGPVRRVPEGRPRTAAVDGPGTVAGPGGKYLDVLTGGCVESVMIR